MQMFEGDAKSRELHELYLDNRARLFKFARSYLRDDAAAEDVVMDSFAELWERREALKEGASPLPYLLTTVRNRCLNVLKSRRVRQRAHGAILDTEARVLELQIASITACDPTELMAEESRRIVSLAISELPPRTREVLTRSLFHDQPYRQITSEMNLTPSAVDHEMRRAKRMLAKKIGRYRPDLLAFLSAVFLFC